MTVLSDVGVLAQVGMAVGLTVTMIGVGVAVTCCSLIFFMAFHQMLSIFGVHEIRRKEKRVDSNGYSGRLAEF